MQVLSPDRKDKKVPADESAGYSKPSTYEKTR
jgi:hypothetical protein